MLHAASMIRISLLAVIGLILAISSLGVANAQSIGSHVVVLEQRSLTSMANGIFFDAEDNLYIASVLGREVIVMNPNTGEILDRIGQERGVDSPDDVTIGPDGSVYWTDLLSGTVGRLQPDGTVTKQFIAPGVNPIAFNDEGQLFVGLDFLGDALYEVDPDLQDEPRLIAENLGNFNAFDFDPNGFLWGPLFSKGKVIMVVPGSGQINELFMPEDSFIVPVAAKFNSRGELHVLDMITGEVAIVDTILGTKEVIGTARLGSDNLAFDSQDRLFVSNNTDGSIIELLPNGTNRVVNAGGMITPAGIGVLPNPDGGETIFVGQQGMRGLNGLTGENQLFHSNAVTGIEGISFVADGPDRLISSSWFANTVQVIDPYAGQVLEAYLDFAVPLNAIRFQGDLIVAELAGGPGTARVTQANGRNPSERTVIAGAEQNILFPTGLAASDNDLWVADWVTGNVWQLIEGGRVLESPTLLAEGLLQPEGMTWVSDNSLLVVETGASRLSKIDLQTGQLTVVAENLDVNVPGPEALVPTWMFNQVAIGPSGVIYVNGGGAEPVVYRIVSPLIN